MFEDVTRASSFFLKRTSFVQTSWIVKDKAVRSRYEKPETRKDREGRKKEREREKLASIDSHALA